MATALPPIGAPALLGAAALLGAPALSRRPRGCLWREAGSLMATVLPLLGASALLVARALLGATALSQWSRGRLRRPRALVLMPAAVRPAHARQLGAQDGADTAARDAV